MHCLLLCSVVSDQWRADCSTGARAEVPSLDLDARDAVDEREALDLVERGLGEERAVPHVRVTRVHMRQGEHLGLPLSHEVECEAIDGVDEGVRAVAPV